LREYDLNQQQDDPGLFVLVEYWTGRSALEQHFAMPYMQEFAENVPALLAAPVSMQLLDMITTPKR
jgi:quinol monooxygenase YgiN